MSKPTPVSKTIYNYPPKDVEGFDSLAELALDMRWSWNHATDQVWRQLDPDAVGNDAEPLGCPADGLAGPTQASAGGSRLPQEH